LTLAWKHRDDPLNIGQESHVEHLVRLIKDQDLHMGEIQVATVGEIDDATRGAYDDVDTCAQSLDLWLVGASAIDREHSDAEQPSRSLDVGCNLQTQFTRRADDQRLWFVLTCECGIFRRCWRSDLLQQRNAETKGLSGSRLGLTNQVSTFQGERDALLLNRECGADAVLLKCLANTRVGAKFGEGGCGRRIDGRLRGGQ